MTRIVREQDTHRRSALGPVDRVCLRNPGGAESRVGWGLPAPSWGPSLLKAQGAFSAPFLSHGGLMHNLIFLLGMRGGCRNTTTSTMTVTQKVSVYWRYIHKTGVCALFWKVIWGNKRKMKG